ncbi:hypothetical protein AVEN_34564-1 [Araneus ventricosus]|uniref:Uncharacterized protein n=1 Tax=Araneus ventricosus TaxID=182803 RepID=A0A4Y2AZY2_ARAVE|nr:hypothetical protein AVEN_34564-1 [Araneus ventricosus]
MSPTRHKRVKYMDGSNESEMTQRMPQNDRACFDCGKYCGTVFYLPSASNGCLEARTRFTDRIKILVEKQNWELLVHLRVMRPRVDFAHQRDAIRRGL